jgi:hypothetical protein
MDQLGMAVRDALLSWRSWKISASIEQNR